MKTRVVHCKKEPYDVYIGRPSKWGNPYTHKPDTSAAMVVGSRDEAVDLFAESLKNRPEIIESIKRELSGKTLGCWCKPARCHGDVLAAIANGEPVKPSLRGVTPNMMMFDEFNYEHMTGVRLAIVGSVGLEGSFDAYLLIFDAIAKYQPDVIISGGAIGIDTMAEEVAGFLGIPFIKHLPEYQAWPAFKKRNLIVAKDCTHLVRIVAANSTTYGSGWTRDRAIEMGKVTEEFVVSPQPSTARVFRSHAPA